MPSSGFRPLVRRRLRRLTAWPRKLGDSVRVAVLSKAGWVFTGLGAVTIPLVDLGFGLKLLVAGGAFLLAAGGLMLWRWVTIGDALARELAFERRSDAERERNRGLNRLQDRLRWANEPRAERALEGLRNLSARSLTLEREADRLAPADAEVLAVVERLRLATLDTLERLATLRESPGGRGGPAAEEAKRAEREMLGRAEDAVSRMAVAVGRLEARRLASPAPAVGSPAGVAAGIDELAAELEGAMEVARRVEERLAEIEGPRTRE